MRGVLNGQHRLLNRERYQALIEGRAAVRGLNLTWRECFAETKVNSALVRKDA
jgi:hypothetical protein